MSATEDSPPSHDLAEHGPDESVPEKDMATNTDSGTQSDTSVDPSQGVGVGEPLSRTRTYSEVLKLNMENGLNSDNTFPAQFEKDGVGPMPVEAYTADGELQPDTGQVEKMGPGEEEPHSETSSETEELAPDILQPGDFGIGIGSDEQAWYDNEATQKEIEELEKSWLPQEGLPDIEPQSPFMVSDISSDLGGPPTDDIKGEEEYEQADLEVKEEVGTKDDDTRASPETAELQSVSLKEGEFGYNPGRESEPGEDTGENPEASRTRRRLSHGEPPHHGAPKQPGSGVKPVSTKVTAETIELRKISLRKGEFGYNPGKEGEPGEVTGENPKASRTRRRLSHSQPPCHSAPKQPTPSKQPPKTVSAEGTVETVELRRVSLTQGEFGYNPGRESDPGEDTGENPEASRTRRRLSHSEPPHHSAPKQPSVKEKGKGRYRQEPGERPWTKEHDYPAGVASQAFRRSWTDPGVEELSHIGIGRGDFGYNVGKASDPGEETGEDPEASQTQGRLSNGRPRHSTGSSRAPEMQELGHIRASKKDIGRQRTKASPEMEELRHIELRSSEFGYNASRGEEAERIRLDKDSSENPSAARARRQALLQPDEERSNFGYRSAPKPRRSNQELDADPAIHDQSYLPHITPSIQKNAPRSERDAFVNNALQSYLEDFLADRGFNATGKNSDLSKIHSPQVLEDAPGQSGLSHDHTTIGDEHRRKAQVTAVVQHPAAFPSDTGAPVTAEQLQQVLKQFKREILDSINSRPAQDSDTDEIYLSGSISHLGPRLGRIERDINSIRRKINTTRTANNADGITDVVRSQERTNGAASGGIAARSTLVSAYKSGKSDINWVVLILGIVAAFSLFALGEMLGSAKHAGKGLGDKLAEWLFKEGRGQKVSGE